MSKTGSAAKVKLNSFDDLFGSSEMQMAGAEQIINAPLAESHDFKNHPFRVVDDEKMEETTESIRQYGVLVPGIARPRTDRRFPCLAGRPRRPVRAGARSYMTESILALPIRSRLGYSSTMDTRFCFVYQMSQRMMT